jgi:hypothetical protein
LFQSTRISQQATLFEDFPSQTPQLWTTTNGIQETPGATSAAVRRAIVHEVLDRFAGKRCSERPARTASHH